jgi:hypothetical protein
VGNILEVLHAENGVIHDMAQLQFLGQVVRDEALRQFIGKDCVQQVKLIHSGHGLLDGDRIEEIADDSLNICRSRGVALSYEKANVGFALLKLLDNFGAHAAGAACH